MSDHYNAFEGVNSLPGKATDECNEFIQIRSACPANRGAHKDNRTSKQVLEPFDMRVSFATSLEDPILHDADGREELERYREENG